MIVGWLLYGLLVAALLGLGALAAESALRAAGWPVRWAWAAALVGTVGLLLAAWLGPSGAVDAGPVGVAGVLDLVPAFERVAEAAAPELSGVVVAGWALASAWVLGLVGLAHVRLRWARRRWVRGEVGGYPVYLSCDVGPAALGLFRGVIVLPEWVLGLEARMRDLVVLHEREHLRVGDPRLVWLGLGVAVAMPWNPFVWWQLHRLRLAIEFDCDVRVLRRARDARTYGALLLEVGRRRSGLGLVAAALSEPRSFLERRVLMLLQPKSRGGWLRAAAFGVMAFALVVLACEVPEPTQGEVDSRVHSAVVSEGDYLAFTPEIERPELVNVSEVVEALERNYPPHLRDAGIEGSVDVLLWIDETGAVTRQQVSGSSGHGAMDEAAVKVAEVMEFNPARKDGEAVPVMVQIPIVFRKGA